MIGVPPSPEVDDFRRLLRAMQLPVKAPANMQIDNFLNLMSRDKKVVDGQLRLVLLRAIGQACIVDDVSNEELRSLLCDALS